MRFIAASRDLRGRGYTVRQLTMVLIEVLVLLACIVIGARLGGIGLGTVAGIGLFVFVFVFRLPPGGPPAVVIGMIIAVVTALSALEAAGGLDYMVTLAERMMRRNPQLHAARAGHDVLGHRHRAVAERRHSVARGRVTAGRTRRASCSR